MTVLRVLGDRKVYLARELTKLHETLVETTLAAGSPEEPRGEYVILVEGAAKEDFSALSPEEHLERYISTGMDKKEAVKRVARERKVPKDEIYKLVIKE